MSISVDDLVASLSSNHIGQEALDLAALQAQLAQAFFAQHASSSQNTSNEKSFHPCTTPTAPSSFSWVQSQRASSSSKWNPDETTRDMDDVEDERMVEDILLPSSPISASSPFHRNSRASRSRSRSHVSSPISPNCATESSPSVFTSTDPFYLAQLQAMQNHNASSPSSVFSQLGRPAQHSPFIQAKLDSPGCFTSPISLETHNMFAATSAAFER